MNAVVWRRTSYRALCGQMGRLGGRMVRGVSGDAAGIGRGGSGGRLRELGAGRWPSGIGLRRIGLQGHAAVEQFDEVGEQTAFGGLQHQGDLVEHLALAIEPLGNGQGAVDRQRAPHAEVAVELVEVGLRPAGEALRKALDGLIDQGIGLAVEELAGGAAGTDEQFVGGDAQALGQAVQRASVGSAGGLRVQQALDGALVDARAGHDLGDGESFADHQTSEITGEFGFGHGWGPGVATEKGGGKKGEKGQLRLNIHLYTIGQHTRQA